MSSPRTSKPYMPLLTGRILGLLTILTVAASSGAVMGIAGAQSPTEPSSMVQAQSSPAAEGEALEATLSVSEAPARGPSAGGQASAGVDGRAAGKRIAAPALKLNIPSLDGGSGTGTAGGGGVKCSRFDDAKITWLMEQVAKTRAEHPEMAAGADKLTAALQGALGKNMCASEAQAIIGQLCTDPAVVRVMNQMVSELPFFIRPQVGDPCTADLVSVLNKVGKYVPGLSSSPS